MTREPGTADRPRSLLPNAEEVEIAKRALYLLTRHLSDEERDRFGLELLDGVRSENRML